MTLRADMGWSFGALSLVAGCQIGFKDWPFNQVRFGLAYNFCNL
jgi:hypothetical protein